MRRTLITATVVVAGLLVAVLLTVHLHREARDKVLSQFGNDQLVVARHLSREIASHLSELAREFGALGELPSLGRQDRGHIAADIASFLDRARRDHIRAVSVLDESGAIVYSTSPGATGLHREMSSSFTWARQTGSIGKVRLSTAVEPPGETGKPPLLSVALVFPIYRSVLDLRAPSPSRQFSGLVSISIDLENLVAEQLNALGAAEGPRQFWVIDRSGTLLFQSAHPDEVPRSIRRTDESCRKCHSSFDYAETMLASGQGVTDYALIERPRKVAGFASMRFENASWVVVVSRPYDEITGFIKDSLVGHLLLLGIAFLSLTGAAAFAHRSFRAEVRAEEERRRLDETHALVDRLQVSEERYRTLYDGVPVGLYVSTPNGDIAEANAALVEMLGYPDREALCRANAAELYLDAEDRLRWQEAMARDGVVRDFEVQLRKHDGTAIWARDSARAVLDGAGNALHYQGTMVDITERKVAERALRESEEKYRLQAEDLALLYEAGQLFSSSSSSPGEVLQEISRRCAEVLGVDLVLLRLIEADRLVMVGSYYRCPEDREELERLLEQHPIRVGTGIAGRVAATGLPLASGAGSLESMTLPGFVDFLSRRSWIVTPMKVKGRVIGVLTFITATPARSFSHRDLSLAQGIANQAAVAIENARLFEAAQQELAERRRAEGRLRETRDFLESLLDYANAPIIVWDPNSTITRFNHAFERLTGHAASEVVGRTLAVLFPAEGREESLSKINRALRGEHWEWVEIPILRKDGATRTVVWNSANVIADDGVTVVATIAQGTDLTEHNRLLEEFQQAQKMEAVGRLAGGVAHDFNNLLQALLSITEVLRSRRNDEARFGETLAELESHVRRGAGLTRQLLLFARRQKARPERLDLNDVVIQTAKLLSRLVRENIRLEVEVWPEPLPVRADRGQLEQVLINLAVNASDAMPAGGELAIRTGSVGDSEVWLEVRDTGVGMSEEVQARIFEPFFTTKDASRGTGLGLAVVDGIVAQHKGRVAVASRPGEGSTFRVVLPRGATIDPVPAVGAPAPSELADGRGERVLLVEDEEGARKGLHEILTMLGYDVTAVGSGEEAVRLPVRPAFHVLVTDFLLPGMNGGELARLLSARWPDLRVIVMSGYSEGETGSWGSIDGSARFLQKPFNAELLAREIRAVLKNAGRLSG